MYPRHFQFAIIQKNLAIHIFPCLCSQAGLFRFWFQNWFGFPFVSDSLFGRVWAGQLLVQRCEWQAWHMPVCSRAGALSQGKASPGRPALPSCPDRALQTLLLLFCSNSDRLGLSVWPSWADRIVLFVCVCEHRLSIFIRAYFSNRKLR